MRASHQIVLASTNLDKYIEMRALLAKYPGLELLQASDLIANAEKIGKAEVYSTYLENAAAKALLVNRGCHFPSLADDSGLEVMALDGRPGHLSARYANGGSNIEKLLGEMKGQKNREARFVCTLAFVMEGTLLTTTGILEGTIAEAPRGTMGFGYDPVFIPKDESRTLAEMTETEKNTISHRARALALLMKKIEEMGIQFTKP